MDADRRESLRRDVRVPFQWRPLDAPVSPTELVKLFDLPPLLLLSDRLADLDAEFAEACRDVRDPATSVALDVLNARVSAMQEALLSQLPTPVESELELAVGGLAFSAPERLAEASWLGVHLVLPACYHVLCLACVCRCERSADNLGYRVAVRLDGLESTAARRLSRFLIGNI